MTAAQSLVTSALLGGFVLFAGGYGLLYCLAKLRNSPGIARAAVLAYVCQGVVTVPLILGPLDLAWKILILGSLIVYFAIPQYTWLFLERLHASREPQP